MTLDMAVMAAKCSKPETLDYILRHASWPHETDATIRHWLETRGHDGATEDARFDGTTTETGGEGRRDYGNAQEPVMPRAFVCLCRVCDGAAAHGNDDVMARVLREHGDRYGVSANAMVRAARRNRPDVVATLDARGDVPCTRRALLALVDQGHYATAAGLAKKHGLTLDPFDVNSGGGDLFPSECAETDAWQDLDLKCAGADDADLAEEGCATCARHADLQRAVRERMDAILVSGLFGDPRRTAQEMLGRAAQCGMTLVVRFLHERWGASLNADHLAPDLPPSDAVTTAAAHNDVCFVRYALVRGATVRSLYEMMRLAAANGALTAVRFLCGERDAEWDADVAQAAMVAGHAHTLAYLCARDITRCNVPAMLQRWATGVNKNALVLTVLSHYVSNEQLLHALEAAHDQKKQRTLRTLLCARGHVLEPLDGREGSDPWEGRAALVRSIACTQAGEWLNNTRHDVFLELCIQRHRAEMDRRYGHRNLQDQAACNGWSERLGMLCRLDFSRATRRAMKSAVCNGHLSIMEILVRHYGPRAPWAGYRFVRQVPHAPPGVLAFMDRHFGWRWWSHETVAAAAEADDLNLVRFLYARRHRDDDKDGEPWCTGAALDIALHCGHWEVASFLHAAGVRASAQAVEEAAPPCGCPWAKALFRALRDGDSTTA